MTNPNASLGDIDTRLRRLKREHDSLSSDVDSIRSDVRKARSAADAAEEATDDLRRRITDQHDTLTSHAKTVSATGALVERLRQQLQQLERAVRVSDGTPVIDLDDVPAATRTLAAEAVKRHRLKEALLPEDTRTVHQAALQRLTQLTSQLTATEDELVRIVTAMAGNHRDSPARAGMSERFTAATRTRRKLRDIELPAAKDAAAAARSELRSDDVTRARVEPQLRKADQAWTDLTARLRTSISDAIGSSALLPTWFTNALGFAPPRGPHGDRWMRTATDVLAYRVTYGIRDQAALGPTTRDGRWTKARLTWLRDLEFKLASLDADD
ncbi:hypothetical protein MUY14_09220 [Amycolatopsis sp. FBCC-B4732]|uniref:hypothetical protein n=1 Tax=Amycolatopsis sp. FBCC-B4732 TaxID=3079339 RepID=UPI001FF529D3|nr:hypothetical protein [Amycolatopsis sp. FBCC-B4732]UOX90785.1 hypothetical protein MUY14_09220 [Amycolatopsis sp. FBCC-B4732]